MAGHALCEAQTRSGGTCARPAGWGTDHVGAGRCKLHGGSTPNGRKAAQRQQAAQVVQTYGAPVDTDPVAALLDLLARTAGHVAWLGQQVAAMDEGDLYGPVGGGPQAYPSAEPHVWVRLYQEERRDLARIAKQCADIGIAERQVRIAEQQAQLFAGALTRILTALGVQDHPEAATVVRRELLALDAGA